jgi:hypothetical protein
VTYVEFYGSLWLKSGILCDKYHITSSDTYAKRAIAIGKLLTRSTYNARRQNNYRYTKLLAQTKNQKVGRLRNRKET